MNRHLSRSLLLLVAAMLATANLTYGQTAEVTGRVTDRNTAVVPGTEVSISSVETGVSRKAVTNDEGYYTIPLLQPGAYQLTVRKEGFKPVARDNVALEVGQTARLDFTLEAGNVNEVLNLRRSWDSPQLAAVPLPPLSRDTSQLAARRFIIANFALPNTNINNQQYGQITATSALPRVIQFALKLGF